MNDQECAQAIVDALAQGVKVPECYDESNDSGSFYVIGQYKVHQHVDDDFQVHYVISERQGPIPEVEVFDTIGPVVALLLVLGVIIDLIIIQRDRDETAN